MKTITLKGKVFSGKREGQKFTELEWAKKQFEGKLGFSPYPGTLNVRLNEASLVLKKDLSNTKAVEILPGEGFSSARCYEATLAHHVKCALVLPQIINYPEDIIELIAPVNLRARLKLKDEDMIEVRIKLR